MFWARNLITTPVLYPMRASVTERSGNLGCWFDSRLYAWLVQTLSNPAHLLPDAWCLQEAAITSSRLPHVLRVWPRSHPHDLKMGLWGAILRTMNKGPTWNHGMLPKIGTAYLDTELNSIENKPSTPNEPWTRDSTFGESACWALPGFWCKFQGGHFRSVQWVSSSQEYGTKGDPPTWGRLHFIMANPLQEGYKRGKEGANKGLGKFKVVETQGK